MRSIARESVFKYIFAKLFNPGDEGLFAVLIKELNDDDKDFATKLLNFLLEKEDEYLDSIQRLSIGYNLERIHKADKCALLIGMAELDNFKTTPIPVVIDEAVNIVSKYSTENSTNFVNGILAEFAKEINNG